MTALLDEWVNRSGMVIDAMAHFDLPARLELDYSLPSLRAVVAAAREHFTDPAEALDTAEQPFVEGLVAYVGECLLRVGRGRWGWDDALGFAARGHPRLTDARLLGLVSSHRWVFDDVDVAGVPVVDAGPALDVAPASPLHLLLAELGNGPGTVAAEYERWERAAATHAAGDPSWTEPSAPILTAGFPRLPRSPELDAWLDQRRHAFPRWAQTYGGGWDFTADTIDALAELVFRVTPTVDALLDPANADFAEGAGWYLGEALRLAYPSRWAFRAYLREPGDPLAVCFTVQTTDDRDFTGPLIRLKLALTRRDPRRLRTGYDAWAAG